MHWNIHGNVICDIFFCLFFFIETICFYACRATGRFNSRSAFTVSYTPIFTLPPRAVMQWHGSNNRNADFKYGLIQSVRPYETPLGRGERKAPEWLPQRERERVGVWALGRRWDRLESGAPVISSSSGLGFSFQGSLHWDWKRKGGGRWEKPSHNHLNDYVNIQMIFVDLTVRFGLGCLFIFLYTPAQI